MAGSIAESKDSRKCTDGDEPSAELRYTIKDTNDDGEARLLLLAAAPPTWIVGGKTLVQQQRSIDPTGGGIWRGSVTYGRRKKEKETGESSYQFEIGGGTHHITEALQQTRYSPAAGGDAPAMQCRVNVTRDTDGGHTINGIDIDAPTYAWSETHYLPIGAVTPAYKAILYGVASAPVNNATWRGFAAGEVKFKGASGQQRGEEDWAVTFKFEASQNVTGLSIYNVAGAAKFTGIAKKGWEYLWILYDEVVDGAAKCLAPEPLGVYVAQVYGTSNFALLGIGG